MKKSILSVGVLAAAFALACGGGADEVVPADVEWQPSGVSFAEGALQVDLVARIVDDSGLAAAGVKIRLQSDRTVDAIEPAERESDEDGRTEFCLRSTHAGNPKLQVYLNQDNSALGDPLDLDLGLSLSMESGPVRLGADGWWVEMQAALAADIDGVPLKLESDRQGLDSIEPESQSSLSGQSVSFAVSSTTEGAPMLNLTMLGIENSNVASNLVVFRHGAQLSAGELEELNPGGRIPLTVSVSDELGPVEGLVLSLTSDRGGADLIEPASLATDAAGQAVFQVSTTEAGQPTLSLEFDGLTLFAAPSLQLDFSGI